MIKINDDLIDCVSQKAKESERKKADHSFNKRSEEPFQLFLNAVEPGAYIRPHKHMGTNNNETLLILK
ncbi:hypothetical protein MSBRW_3406 [Methanosarcina barkeri str. Wiesmoor]|uniref:Cupin fold metalloprotein WbuC cupin domain-containing protein n=2 Tax=Methanosarcina barkeri TaxID=2208 RepID=A0A0E3QQ31_METBA|nr:WbuC family cupin fold metalloprotein [Methanosarcina barkeri]AKB52659.1 hypothetical protein MSBRW_3406 [Methanosarcina barkeri str. Wiesmoor]